MKESNFLEKRGPIVAAIIAFVCTIIISTKCDIAGLDQYLNDLLNAVITFSSILIGFIGVLLGLLFSLRDRKVVAMLFQYTTKDILKKYFKRTLISGTVVVGISILLYVRNLINFVILSNITSIDILGSLWFASLIHLVFATYILIDIIMYIVFDGDTEQNSDTMQFTKDYSQLEEKHKVQKKDTIPRDKKI